MIDFTILRQYGTSNENLRKVFANWDGRTKEGKPHKLLRALISGRIQEGADWSLRQSHHYTAADIMWDGPTIQPSTIPLQLYASGRIALESCSDQLERLNCASKFVEEKETTVNGKTEKKKQVNIPKFVETCIQIGRSYISRRLYAQQNRYNSQKPFLPYETRFATQTGKLRAALMSQYAQLMSDSYGYPDGQTQFTRDMLLYGHSTVFPECAWDDERQIVRGDGGPTDKEVDGVMTKVLPMKTRIIREGIPFKNVHPARVFYDQRFPLRTVNTDTGCQWIGFWDVWRFGQIEDDSRFFNKDRVRFSKNFRSLVENYASYFDLYFADDPVSMVVRPPKNVSGIGLFEANERTAQATAYAVEDKDVAVMLTDLRMKIVPRTFELGDYPHPVWLRLLVAQDDTVIFAEWLPSRPAFVASFNENDSRLVNQGQAHEIMPFQDQISNLMSQLVLSIKHKLLRILAINKDLIDNESWEALKAVLHGEDYFVKPHLVPLSFSKLEDTLGTKLTNLSAVINMVESSHNDDFINSAFKAITMLLGILERLLMLSPQEQGQPAPRETTATENAMIESTTQAVYTAISDAIDSARAAQRVIIYESAMAMASNEIFLPVSQTFDRRTIEAAGLKVIDDEVAQENQLGPSKNRSWKVIGTKQALEHNYIFTGRDVGDKPTNQQAATTLLALLSQVLPLIGPESIGKERIFEMINEVFRLVGVYSMKLEIGETESMSVGEQEAVAKIQELAKQVVPEIQRIAKESADNRSGLEQIAGHIGQLVEAIQKVSTIVAQQPSAGALPPAAAPAPAPTVQPDLLAAPMTASAVG